MDGREGGREGGTEGAAGRRGAGSRWRGEAAEAARAAGAVGGSRYRARLRRRERPRPLRDRAEGAPGQPPPRHCTQPPEALIQEEVLFKKDVSMKIS